MEAASVSKFIDPVHPFPIVALGASAGGLAAFEQFFAGLGGEKEPGLAFVLIQHLAPDTHSILTDIIARRTSMRVLEIEDGMRIRVDHVYVIPPNRDLSILNGVLQLFEPAKERSKRLPIDYFLSALADDQGKNAVAAILSGTGSDGAKGIRAIKKAGGLCLAEDPSSSEYNGMPQAAIATGLIDVITKPSNMIDRIKKHRDGLSKGLEIFSEEERPLLEAARQKVIVLLRQGTGRDFSLYKQSAINRRIERRMAINQMQDIDEYVRFIQQNKSEVQALYYELLIGVTNFFRDPHSFEVLESLALPTLFKNKTGEDTLRVWVPACSTGEEAYSIAILLQEYIEAHKINVRVQIFATDIDDRAIEKARSGLFSSSIAKEISGERLARFFIQEGGERVYRIRKSIRDMLIFSTQDLVKDPPFSRLDLISCRNLLIYMSTELQKSLFPIFHYALKPDAILFLGSAETIGDFSNLFMPLDSKCKIYIRKEFVHRPISPDFGKAQSFLARSTSSMNHSADEIKPRVKELTEALILKNHAPIAALVNARSEILYFHGEASPFFSPAAGEASLNLIKMAREGLKHDLSSAFHRAVSRGKQASVQGIKIKLDKQIYTCTLTIDVILPEADLSGNEILYLVVIHPQARPEEEGFFKRIFSKGTSSFDVDERVISLKKDLQAKEEYLQNGIEELKSSNEELQSVNEELQSTNEELETSKEELQSVNEELVTVNNELQTKVGDLSQVNNDMNNLLASTDIGTVFVDKHLCIQRFTPAATLVLNLIPSDVGRPLSHIVSNLLSYGSLVEDIQRVLETLIPKEVEVPTKNGTHYLIRIRPYRTLDNLIEGAVLAFIDITELARTKDELRKANEAQRLAIVVRDSYDAILVTELNGRIIAWNAAATKMYGYSEEEALGMNSEDLLVDDDRPEIVEKILRTARGLRSEPFKIKRLTKDGHVREVWLTASALLHEDGQIYAVSSTERGIS